MSDSAQKILRGGGKFMPSRDILEDKGPAR